MLFQVKILFFIGFAIAFAEPSDTLIGGATTLSGDDLNNATETLKTSLSKVAAGDGPNYQLGKVVSVTRQVVSGSLYKYKVELLDQNKANKKCTVEIWSQPWLENGIQVTFDCEGEEKLVKKHSA